LKGEGTDSFAQRMRSKKVGSSDQRHNLPSRIKLGRGYIANKREEEKKEGKEKRGENGSMGRQEGGSIDRTKKWKSTGESRVLPRKGKSR